MEALKEGGACTTETTGVSEDDARTIEESEDLEKGNEL